MPAKMQKLALLFFAALLVPTQAPAQAENDLWESTGPHVRIKRDSTNGTYVEFKRDPEDRKLVKTTKDANGTVLMTSTYFRNDSGFLTAGRIHDAMGTALYKVRYGYSAKTGQLIAEETFDAQTERYFPGTRKEMPLRRIYYFYDAQGNQSKAISLVPRAGKMAEEVFDPKNSTRPDQNPFDAEKKK